MRKKVNVIVILLLTLCLFAFAACKQRDADGLIKLKTPKDLELSGSALSWEEVDNAEKYYISVAGEEKAETTSSSYDLSSIVSGYGNFSVKVRAYGDGKTYGTSDWSKEIIYRKGYSLDAPKIAVDADAKKASWQAVENAVNYTVVAYNGKDEEINRVKIEETSYAFADKLNGEGKSVFEAFDKYRLTVVAHPEENSEKYSDSAIASEYYYNSTVLSKPEFTSMSSSRIQWGAVTNAKSYRIRLSYKDGSSYTTVKEVTTTGTSYARSNFTFEKVGEYYFSIMAVGDNEVYYDSGYSDQNDSYKVSKIDGVKPENISMAYDENGKMILQWSISADSLANQFNLSLKALLPDGSSKLSNTETSRTISNKVTMVSGKVYGVFQYISADNNDVAKVDGKTMVVYNMNGALQVQYDGKEYPVFDRRADNADKLNYSSYSKGDSVDIVYDGDKDKFVYEKHTVFEADGETLAVQATDEDKDVLNGDGNQLYYFDEDTKDIGVEKSVVFRDGEPIEHRFVAVLDNIFYKETVTENEDNTTSTTYEYLIKDETYYGILYDVAVAAGNSSYNYVSSAETVTAGKYLSYKMPSKNEYGWQITNAGEYAYIALKNYLNNKNNVTETNRYSIEKNINFNGYEIVQIENFVDSVEGNDHTLSNMVVGNRRLSDNGAIEVNELVGDELYDRNYSLYIDVKENASINHVFYMGIDFVGYEKDEDEEGYEQGVRNIYVAPIAINNYGTISNVFVQSNGIKADSAYAAGIAINNYSQISGSQVYADLTGRTVAGVAIKNEATVSSTGFYGNVTATLGEYLTPEGMTFMAAAGLVVENKQGSNILNCEAIGNVNAEASQLDKLVAGGLVAVNSGNIMSSFGGEYVRFNVASRKEINAKGNNSYAGGLVGENTSTGKITESYATGRATASKYAGGFVGLNAGEISVAYALGGTTRGGDYYGVFAGQNTGAIEKAAAFSSDSWAKTEDYYQLFTDENDLGGILNALYPEGEKNMTLVDMDGYRYPIFKNRVYTKSYVVEMSPAQTPDVKGIIVIGDEQKNITVVGDDIFGDRSARGNKVVIRIKHPDSNRVRLVYGIVR